MCYSIFGDKVTIGERIKKFRKEKDMTQKQVGDNCGMPDSAIRKYESGVITPKPETLGRIINALGIDIPTFFEGIKTDPDSLVYMPARDLPLIMSWMAYQERLKFIEELTPEGRKALFSLVAYQEENTFDPYAVELNRADQATNSSNDLQNLIDAHNRGEQLYFNGEPMSPAEVSVFIDSLNWTKKLKEERDQKPGDADE